MKKFLLFIMLPTIIFIGLGFFWYKYRPFIICPEGYDKVIRNFAGKTKFCEDESGKKSGIYYDRNYFGEVRLDIYDNNKRINHKYYDREGYLFKECYPENGLRKCTAYYDGKFNFLEGIKNFFNGIWSWYDKGSIFYVEYENEENYINQGPYYGYYENGNLSYSGNYDNGIKVGLWRYYNEDGSISSEIMIDN